MKTREILLIRKPGLAATECLETNIQQTLSVNQWTVYNAGNVSEANDLLQKHRFYTGLVLVETCDDKPYLEYLKDIFEHNPFTNWIMLLPSPLCTIVIDKISPEQQLISEFCYDYISLPFDGERLLFALGHAYKMSELIRSPYENLASYPACYGIMGSSSLMNDVYQKIKKVAPEHCSILIEGETGTGKELVANAIHKLSERAGHPIITVNCGAIPRELVQAELFGYEKGAFTGAAQRKLGRIEAAQGGTLFLDEIGDLPLEQQVNLLRFLEQKSIERVGGTEKIPVDVRVISATHVDLDQAVQNGTFREDLYYRLRILHINIPPLRKRGEDIELLAWYFFYKLSAKYKQKCRGLSLNALSVIRHYGWPGNVREMHNRIMQAIVMSENRLLTVSDLELERRTDERQMLTLEESRNQADKRAIKARLTQNNYNMTQSAKQLGISRVTLYRLMEKHDIDKAFVEAK
jgi:DNA-binding NtrC family response regulator